MDALSIALIAMGAAAGLASPALFGLVISERRRAEGLASRLSAAEARAAEADRAAALAEGERESLRAALGETRASLEAERTARQSADQALARREAEFEAREKALAEERESLTSLSNAVRERFQLLAGEVLDESQKRFLERAGEAFKAHHERAQGGVEGLVKPLKEKLEAFSAQVKEMETARAGQDGRLEAQVKALSDGLSRQHAETAKLVNALQRSSTARGQWGERTVENILELAGLTAGVDYEKQHQTRSGEGDALRPDFVVRLPGGSRFVIDAKVALTAYLEAVEAPDEAARKDALRRHAAQVRAHVRALAKKEYAKAVDWAVDFVALFIPGESFYAAAMEEDPELFNAAIAQDVIITTPATLLALAKAVAYGFRQQDLEENAKQIAALGVEIYERLQVFSGHLSTVGSGLKTAVANYNKAAASLESRVLVSARRMGELSGGARKALQGPDQVEETPRSLAALEAEPEAAKAS